MPSNIYQSEFTGEQMDARFAAVAELQSAVTALETAVAAKYAKPADGIPSTDMDAAVQNALAKALTAVQSLADYYTKAETDALLAAIAASVNATAGVTDSSLPTASASTVGKMYYIGPDGNGEYARYVTAYDGTNYSWLSVGTTDIDLTQYATKAELNQLDQKVSELNADVFGGNFSKNLTWTDGYIKTNGQIMSSTASKFTQPFVLKAGEKLTVGTSNANICIIGTTSAVSLSVGDTITVLQTTANSSAFETHTLIADEDMTVVVCVKWSDYSLTFEETDSFKQDYDKKVIPSTEHTRNLADFAQVMDGFYISGSDYMNQEAGCKSIKFPCDKNKTYTISKTLTTRFKVGLSSVEPAFNTAVTGAINTPSATSITITTGNDTLYIVAFIYNSSGESTTWADVLASLQIEEGSRATPFIAATWTAKDIVAREDLSGLHTNLDDVPAAVDALEETVNGATKSLGTSDVVSGYYRVTNGTLAEMSSYFYSNPIKVHKGDVISTSALPTLGTYVSVISKVSSENAFISTLLAATDVTAAIRYVVSEECYISISALNNDRALFSIAVQGCEERLSVLENDLGLSAGNLPHIGVNPLAQIRRDAGYGCILRKWGIIGDSLSSGEMQCFNDESTDSSDYKFIDMYKYSSGQVFARLIGADAYNYSNGGQTTYTWLTGTGVVHDDTYVGGAGGGTWALAKVAGQEKDAYIIALGVNDATQISRGEYELGSVSQITTYDGTNSDINDTTTYPKSFARYYAGIIQRILSIQPKARIFCVTPIGSAYESVAQVIRDEVEHFGGNVYLIDMATYIPGDYKVAGFMLNGHLSPMGYAYIGYLFNTYIDWIIRNNGAAFRDTALIGTDYRADYS